MITWERRRHLSYGWVIVAVVCLSNAVLGLYVTGTSLFLVALIGEFDWSHSETSLAFSISLGTWALTSILAGMLTDRFGARVVLPLGAAVLASGLLLSSQLETLGQFYLYAVLTGLGHVMLGFTPATTLLARWFTERLGTAIGIVWMGRGLGTLFLTPLLQVVILTHGWRWAFAIEGALVALLIPLLAALLRNPPRQRRRAATTAAPSESNRHSARVQIVDATWANREWTLDAALRTKRFWYLLGMYCTLGASAFMLQVHQAAVLVESGFDPLFVASVIGLSGLVLVVGPIPHGLLSDRLGRELALVISTLLRVLGIVALMQASPVSGALLPFLYAVVYNLGRSGLPVNAGGTVADLFQGRHLGTILGALEFGSGIGGAVGTWVAGWAFDVTGSYQAPLLIVLASTAAPALFIWLIAPRTVRRVVAADSVP
ncbi:MAG: hypothetical protein CL878_12845 [Dehalococcoidia bacterium]|nr:hypothetical protein [Dehalococcoidia bacterium]